MIQLLVLFRVFFCKINFSSLLLLSNLLTWSVAKLIHLMVCPLLLLRTPFFFSSRRSTTSLVDEAHSHAADKLVFLLAKVVHKHVHGALELALYSPACSLLVSSLSFSSPSHYKLSIVPEAVSLKLAFVTEQCKTEF